MSGKQFSLFDTISYVYDRCGTHCLKEKMQLAARLQDAECEMNTYHIAEIREEGNGHLTGEVLNYADDRFSVHALAKQEAYQMADFICRLLLSSQQHLTWIKERAF